MKLPSIDWFKKKIATDPDIECEAGQRFFIDHGVIHDKVTGKHVVTDQFMLECNGQKLEDTLNLLNSL